MPTTIQQKNAFSPIRGLILSSAALFYISAAIFLYSSGVISISSLDLRYFFLFPTGVLIAVIAMSSGISGANFWVPINVIVLDLEPRTGFWLALFTMLFGFGSGVIAHLSQKNINVKLVLRYFSATAPGAMVGALLLPHVETSLLLVAFGIFVALYGLRILFARKRLLGDSETTTLLVAFTGGLLKGLIATGLGKLLMPRLINQKTVSHPEAVGTTVAVVFLTNIIAVMSVLIHPNIMDSLIMNREHLFSIMVFVVPAVVVGGQIGPRIPRRISKKNLIRYVGCLLLIISLFMIVRGLMLLQI